ncbi:hypothetical protein L5876_14140 [Hyphobacterium sp. SN044]|uniref:hypothetical protein n=1 Tax=Hyphobacterium sp. SN044 TaxID=2912575 RepID=UPI001F299323|nr:hypothetical protein [Hyphobacterium sp. SN044]MCF8880964.1 hypothetical protein [Hyphobacterium sp. SN044]
MTRRRRAFLERTHRAQERARRSSAGFNPTTMIRWAGLGAAAMIGLAVYVGFAGGDRHLEGLASLDALTRPAVLGASWLDVIAIGVVAAIVAMVLLRSRVSRRDGNLGRDQDGE